MSTSQLFPRRIVLTVPVQSRTSRTSVLNHVSFFGLNRSSCWVACSTGVCSGCCLCRSVSAITLVATLQAEYRYPDLYHLAFPGDGWVAKSLVYSIYLLDTAQTFIVTSDVFETYARHYGDMAQLKSQHNEWLAVPIFSSIGTSSALSVACLAPIVMSWQ